MKITIDGSSSYCKENNLTRVMFDIPNDILYKCGDEISLRDRILLAIINFDPNEATPN